MLLHSVMGAIRLNKVQGNKRDTRLLNDIKEHIKTQQYCVFVRGTPLFKIDVALLKDSVLILCLEDDNKFTWYPEILPWLVSWNLLKLS